MNPANKVTLSKNRTFEREAKDISDASMTSLSYGNGAAIELKPNKEYCFLMLGMEKLWDTAVFTAFKPVLEEAIEKAALAGIIPPTGIPTIVGTPFDVPIIENLEETFEGLIPEGEELHIALRGTLNLEFTKEPIPLEVEVEEEPEE